MSLVVTKSLRINNKKNLLAGKIPLNMSTVDIPSSLSIAQEEIEKVPSIEANEGFQKNPVWRLYDSTGNYLTHTCRELISTDEEVEQETYFLLIDSNQDSMEIYPLNEFHKFLPDISNKVTTTSSELAEKEANQSIVKEADLTARVLSLRKQDSDDEAKFKKEKSKQRPNFQYDDYGIKRQEVKHWKSVLKAKQGYSVKPNDYVNSVLNISSLRHNPGTWDYNEGERSDDEEDVLAPSTQPMEGYDEEFSNKDNDFDNEYDDTPLSRYGQAVMTLLKNQANQDVEDELNQYLDEEDESQLQTANEAPEPITTPSDNYRYHNKPISSLITSSASSVTTKDELEKKIIRTLMQNMGRMDIKLFTTQFVSKEKKEHHSTIQEAITKMCTIQVENTNGNTKRFISLKPDYRHRH